MKIIDIVPEWKEICKDFGVSDKTEKDFMDYFELNGEIMMRKEFHVNYGFGHIEADFEFYCGPSIGDGCVSDSVYIDSYLQKICKDLNIKCDIGVAENYHTLRIVGDNKDLAEGNFNKIKDRISQDFKVDIN